MGREASGASGYCVSALSDATKENNYCGAIGSLSDTDFTLYGTNYTVRSIRWGTDEDGGGNLHLTLDREFPDNRLSVLTLQVGSHTFALSAARRGNTDGTGRRGNYGLPNNYRWSQPEGWTHPATNTAITVKLLKTNSAATGKPSIMGTWAFGQTLTAAKGTIADIDGVTKADNGEAGFAYAYQWIRVDSDGSSNAADISGATSSTYVLAGADRGKKVKVRVSFKDDAGNAESRTSDAYPPSGTVAAAATVVTGIAVVSSPPSSPGGWYGRGNAIKVEVTFDGIVAVAGTPQLKIRVGSGSGSEKTASCARKGSAGDERKVLVCSYTVAPRDEDADGISVERDKLSLPSGATIRDAAGNDIALTYAAALALGAQSGHKVDALKPSSDIGAPVPAGPAQSKTVTVTLSDSGVGFASGYKGEYWFVSGSTTCGGSYGAAHASGSVKRFTSGTAIAIGDESRNGQYLCFFVTDRNGNGDAPRSAQITGIDTTDPGIAFPASWKPTTGVPGTIRLTDSNAKIAKYGAIAVAGTETTAAGCDTAAEVGSGNLTTLDTPISPVDFRYTPAANSAGKKVCAYAEDAAGNSHAALWDTAIAAATAVTGIAVVSSPPRHPGGWYKGANAIEVEVTFGGIVAVAGTPQLKIRVGSGAGSEKTASCARKGSAGDDRRKLICSYTVEAGDEDTDGVSVERNKLSLPSGATVRDAAGNDIALTYAAALALGAQSGHKVDAVRPSIDVGAPDPAGPAQSKSVTATVEDSGGGVWSADYWFVSGSTACSASRAAARSSGSVKSYSSGTAIAIGDESRNGQYLCFFAVDRNGNSAYDKSAPIAGIDTTDPDILFPAHATLGLVTPVTGESEPIRLQDSNAKIKKYGAIPVAGTATDATGCDTAAEIGSALTTLDTPLAFLNYRYAPPAGSAGKKVCAYAEDAAGNSHARLWDKAIAQGVPAKPTGLTATARGSSVALGWDDPDDATVRRHQYRQKAGTNAYGRWRNIPGSAPGGSNATSYTVTGLNIGTAYRFQIRAVNAAGRSEASDEAGPATPVASVTGIAVVSSPPASPGGWYKGGNAIKVEVTFGGIVAVAGTPQLKIRVGAGAGSEKTASCARKGSAGDQRKVLVCSYTVSSDDEDTDGVSVERNKLSLPSGATVRDAAGNDIALTYAAALALGAQSGHKVDAKAPTIDVGAPEPAGPAQSKSVTATVEDSGVGVWRTQYWFVSGACTDLSRQRAFINGSLTRYTSGTAIAIGDESRNGQYLCFEFFDRNGNGGTTTRSARIAGIDTTDPGIAFPASWTPTTGLPGTIRLTDSNAKIAKYAVLEVDGAAANANGCDDPSAGGDNFSTTAVSPAASPTEVEYTPVTAGKKICAYAEDAAGNSHAALWDTAIAAATVVTGIAVVSSPPSSPGGWYKGGNAIEVEVTFDGIVAVAGTPQLKIRVGAGAGSEKTASCARKGSAGDQRKVLVCSYTVDFDDEDTDGVSVERNKLSLPSGATVTDAAGNAATLTYAAALALGAQSGHKVDAKAPTIDVGAPEPAGPAQSKSVTATVEDSGVGVWRTQYWFVSGACTDLSRQRAFINGSLTRYTSGTAIAIGDESRNGQYLCFEFFDRNGNGGNTTRSAQIAGIDTTDPDILFPAHATLGLVTPVTGESEPIRLQDSNAKIKKYGAIPVAGTATDATGCDTAAEIGSALTTLDTPLAFLNYRYAPPAGSAGKKVCAYAEDAAGNSHARLWDKAIAQGVPAKPTGLTATARGSSVALGWDDPDDATVRRHQYRQKAGTNAYGRWRNIPGSAPGGSNATSYTVTGLNIGTAYRFQIRAVNAAGRSEASDEAGPATPVASVTGIAVVSSPPASPGGWYKGGNAIKVEVTFGGIVAVAGTPQLKIRVGAGAGSEKTASCARKGSAGDQRKVLVCSYTVSSDDEDTDGVSVERNKLSLPSGATVRDAAGNDIALTYAAALALGAQSGHKVDAKAPTIDVGAPEPAGPAQSKSVTATVEDSGVGVWRTQYWFVSGACTDLSRQRAFINGSLTRYTSGTAIAIGDESRNGQYLCFEFFDRNGNGGTTTRSARIAGIDTTDPGIAFPASWTPTTGLPGTIRLTDSNAKIAKYAVLEVDGAAANANGCDDPSAGGDNFSTTAVSPAASPTEVEYTPVTAGKKICAYAEDAAGNSHAALWDTAIAAATVVTGIAVVSSPPSSPGGWYKGGNAIEVEVTFDGIVAVAGTPQLKIRVGAGAGSEKTASCARKGSAGDQRKVLVCSYTVDFDDEDTDGVSVERNKLSLPSGATVTDAAGNAATLTYAAALALGAQSGHKVDAKAPTIDVGAPEPAGPAQSKSVTATVEDSGVGVWRTQYWFVSGACTDLSRQRAFINGSLTRYTSGTAIAIGDESRNGQYLCFEFFDRNGNGGNTTRSAQIAGIDTTDPDILFPAHATLGLVTPVTGESEPIRLQDSNAKIKKYGAIPVAGTATDATGCDTAAEIGSALTTLDTPLAFLNYRYAPPAGSAGKKVCAYAEDAAGNSHARLWDKAIAQGVPAKPTGLTATARGSSVALGWDDPDDATVRRHQYRQKAGTNAYGRWRNIPGSAPGGSNATSYTVTGLNIGTAYRFQIRAVNAAGRSEASDEAGPATPVASVTGIAVVSSPPASPGGWYKGGNAIKVEVTFGGIVAVAGTPQLKIRVGAGAGSEKTASCARKGSAGDQRKVLVCSYTVSSDDEDTDGVSVERNKLSLPSGATVRDAAGNDIALTYAAALALGAQSGHKVDAKAPTIDVGAPEPAGPAQSKSVTATVEDSGVGVWRTQYWFVSGACTDLSRQRAFINGSLTRYTSGTAIAIGDESRNGQYLCFEFFDRNGNGGTTTRSARIAGIDTTDPGIAFPASWTPTTGLPGTISLTDSNAKIAKYGAIPVVGTSTDATGCDTAAEVGSGNLTTRATPSASVDFAYTPPADSATKKVCAYAEDAAGNSHALLYGTAIAQGAPAQPTGLKATPGNAKVTLAWTDPADSTITKYQVAYKKKSASGDPSYADIPGSGATTTSHAVTGLDNGDAYQFWLRAVNSAGNGTHAGPVEATPEATDTTPPTVTAAGYYAEAGATTALAGPLKAGADIYAKVTFSEDMKHVKSDAAAARPALSYRIGSADTRYHILDSGDTLASGDCRPADSTSTDVYVCHYTVGSSDNGAFTVKAGTNSVDKAGHALAAVYTHATTLTLDTTAPAAPSGLALASGTTSPGADATPSIEVTVGETGGEVTLYGDAACATAASAPTDVTDATSPYKATVDATALASDGSVTFYAKHADAAGNASACSTVSVAYVHDGTDPRIAFPSGTTPTAGTAATIALTDATSKVAKYGAIAVAGAATDATGCDTAAEVGAGNLTTRATPSASVDFEYTPPADSAGKKVCAYAEDAAGNSHAALWGTAIAAENEAPAFSSEETFSAEENQTAVGTVEAADANAADGVAYAVTGGADQAKFAIVADTGVLSFAAAPDFEDPQDAASTTPSNAAANNEYVLVVTATGGTGARAMTAEQTITVTVTNVDEAGTVTFGSTTPRVGEALTASVEDPDGGVSSVTWQWAKAATKGGTYTDISGATSASYTAAAGDAGAWLRATAGYADAEGSGKSANAVAAAAVAEAAAGPAVTAIAVASSPPASPGGWYTSGGASVNIEVDVTFDEVLAVTGSPELKIRVGSGSGSEKTATCARKGSSGDDRKKLACSYTVASGDEDTDGISVERNKLSLPSGAAIKDGSGNAATLTYPASLALAAQSGHKVDAKAPTINLGAPTPAGPAQSKSVAVTVADTGAGFAPGATTGGFYWFVDAATTCDRAAYLAASTPTTSVDTGSSVTVNSEARNGTHMCLLSEDRAFNQAYAKSAEITGIDTTDPGIAWPSSWAPKTGVSGTIALTDSNAKIAKYGAIAVAGAATDATGCDTAAEIGAGNLTTLATPSASVDFKYTPPADSATKKVCAYAEDAAGNSHALLYGTAIAQGVPAQPTGLKATPGNAKVTLAWTDPADSTITKYQVAYKKKSASGDPSYADIPGSGATTTSHAVTGLDNGDAYQFWLRAVNSAGNGTHAGPVEATPEATDTTPPTVTAAGYYAEAGATTALAGPLKAGADIYAKVTFSEDMKHVKSDAAAARPALSYRIGSADTRYHILDSGDTLASGDCRPEDSTSTDVYLCHYTVRSSDNGAFTVKAGTNSVDKAGHALAAAYTHATTLTLDTTAPAAPSGLALASGTTSPGADATPSIEVTVGETGGEVTLYGDAACATAASAPTDVTDATSPYKATVDATALASDGSVTFYAKHADAAGNASACSTPSVAYVHDGTDPRIVFPSGTTPTAGTAATIALTDATSKVAKYGAIPVVGTSTDATGCDTAAEVGAGNLTTRATPSASVDFEYTPPADSAGKKVCAYAEDAAGNSHAALWGTAIAAENEAPAFSSEETFSAEENQTAVGTVEAADANAADGVAYAVTGGADQAKFAIVADTGVLSFAAAPDFEDPQDAASTTPSNAAANNEYVLVVTATGGTGARAMTAEQTITVTVTNVDEAGTVTFGSTTPRVGEALTASVEDPDGGVSSVTWQWAKAATKGGAYADISGATSASYTAAAGDAGAWLRATAGYADAEGSGKSANAVAAAAVAENDTAGATVTPTALTVDEGSTGTYSVKLATQPTAAVTVTVGGTSGDVTVDKSSLTFSTSNWGTAQTVTVSAAEDDDATTDEAVTLTHTPSGGGYGSVSIAGVTVSVTENDTAGATVTPTALTVEEGSTGTYSVKLATQPTAAVTVTVGGTSGDVTVDKSALTFSTSNWGTAQTVTVSAAEDDDATTDDAVTLTHTPSGGGYGSVSIPGVTVSVTDNDTAGATVTPTALTVTEGSTGTYSVKLATQPTAAVTVTVGGTSGDVTVDKSALTFSTSNWGTAQTVTVSAAEDDDATTDDAVTLTHTPSGGGYGSVSIPGVTVSVTENDTAGATVTPTALTVTEGSTGTYSVKLATQPTAAVTVTVGGTSGDVTVDKSALTFSTSNWGTAQTVTVSAAEDDDATTDEAVTLTHTPSGGGYGSVSIPGVTVSVTDNDTAGATVTPTALTVTEGSTGTYSVKLATQPTAAVTVTVGGTSGDVTVDKSALTFSTSNWGTAQTVTVSAAEDDDATADEAVTLTHTPSGGDYGSVSIPGVTVSVTENDTAGATVTPTALTVAEGSTGTYSVKLATQPTAAVTVAVGGTSGDVTVDKTALTFSTSNWGTAQTVTVSAAEDDDATTDDAVTLTHTPSGGGYGSVSIAGVTVSVTENDTAGATVTPTALTVDEGSTGTYTVKLATQPTAAVTVTVGGTSGDVSVDKSSLTFSTSNWGTAQTVTVSAAEDDDATTDEAVTLTHTPSGGGYGSVSIPGVTVSVTENDTAGATVTPTALTVDEGSTGTYTVKLATQPTAAVTVTVGGISGDVTVDKSALTFSTSNWGTAQTVTVSAAEDDDATADDAVTLTHTPSGGGYGSVSIAGVTVSVTENDTAGATVTPTALTVTEGAMDTYTVKLATQPTAAVTVTVGGTSGDVTVDKSALTFSTSNWGTAQTVTVSAAEDDDATTDEAVTLTHTPSGGGYGSVSIAAVTVSVTENDTAGATVTPTALTVDEGSTGTYSVKLATQPTAAVTVTVGGISGDVTVDKSALTFSTSNWGTAQTVTVSAAEDDDATTDEAVTLTHTPSGGGYGSVSIAGVTVSVTENDTAGATVTPTALTVTEGSTDTYSVKLATQPTAAVTVTVGGTSGDVTVDKSALTFSTSNWGTAQTVTVSAAEDDDATTDDAVTLTHTPSGGGYGSASIAGVTVTVTENDTAGATVTPTALTVDEGSTGTYTVKLATQPTAAVTVTVGGTSGDVTVDKTALTFSTSNWGTAQTVTVSAAEDDDATTDEAVTLTHTPSGGGYGSVSIAGVAVSVTENDTAGATVTPTALTVDEGATGTYAVKLATQPTAAVTVTVGGTSGDVTVDKSALTFSTSNWGTAQTVTVSAAEDDDATTDDAVTLTHTPSGGGYGSASIASVTVSVTENDTAGATVTPTALTVDEGATGTYTVKLATQPTAAVTVTVGGTSGDVTVDKSALTFSTSNWGTAQTVTVSAAEDDDATTDEAVTLTHTPSGGGYGSVSIPGVTVSVTEKGTPGATVTPTSLTLTEGSTGTYTVKLATQPTAAVTVTVGGTSGDVTVDKSALTFSTSNWGTAQTVTVSAAEDDDATTDEAVTLTHTPSGGGYGSVSIPGVTVSVAENDTAGAAVTPTALTVDEGATGTYTVKLATQPSAAVTVTVGGTSGDVTVDKSALTFSTSNWGTAQTVTVSAAEDDDATTDDAVTLTHTPSGGGYGSVSIAAVTVSVTEKGTPGATVTPTSLTLTEGSTGTYTVKLATQPSAAVTVTVGGAAGDVSVDKSSLTFSTSDWGTAQTVTVSTAADDDATTDDAVTLTHTPSGGGYGSVSIAAVTVSVTDNDTDEETPQPTPQPLQLALWTDRPAYHNGENIRLYRTLVPHDDRGRYVTCVYLERVGGRERRYLAPLSDAAELHPNPVDYRGIPLDLAPALTIVEADEALSWEGEGLEPGLWRFVLELLPGAPDEQAQEFDEPLRTRRAWASFTVAERSQLLNRRGFDREIRDDLTLRNDTIHYLGHQLFVRDGATLTIEPGTLVQAWGRNAAIIVEPGGRIVAEGTREAPVVLTCSVPVGQREPGCWGGLRILGRAPVTRLQGEAPGVLPAERAVYGGTEAEDSSGVLRYVRVEFAGAGADPETSAPAIGLYGAGSGTVLDHVQARTSLGDGFAFAGGTAICNHCVASGSGGAGLSWERGYRGGAAHLYVQHGRGGSDGISGGHDPEGHDREPRSLPALSNVTLVHAAPYGRRARRAVALRLSHGSGVTARDLLAARFGGGAIRATGRSRQLSDEGQISVRSALLWINGSPQVPDFLADAVEFSVHNPELRDVRDFANPDPRPKPSLANVTHMLKVDAHQREGYVGAFDWKQNWLDEWTVFGPESAYDLRGETEGDR